MGLSLLLIVLKNGDRITYELALKWSSQNYMSNFYAQVNYGDLIQP